MRDCVQTITLLLSGLAFAVSSWGQTPDATRLKIASMEQDIQSLSVQMRQMQLDIEQLRRENAALREQLRNREGLVSREQVDQAIRSLRSEIDRANDERMGEVIQKVGKQIEGLASQTQNAMQALAASIEGQPRTIPSVEFSQDYPKEGIAYTVEPGDTLSGIARRFGSTITDIQNANKIADPKQLRVGQHLFIPIREKRAE